jgi:hypothetical protein
MSNETTSLAVIKGPIEGPITCQLTDEALKRVSHNIVVAQRIGEITSRESLALSTRVRIDLRDNRIDLTEDKKARKAPLLRALEVIDDVYEGAIVGIHVEEKRLADMANSYGKRLQDAADKERQAKEDQAKHIEQELLNIGESQSKLLAAIDSARRSGNMQKCRQLEERLGELRFQAEQKNDQVEEVRSAPVTGAPLKVKVSLDYEIDGRTELDKHKSKMLFASHFPELCDIEPKRSLVKAALNNNAFGHLPEKDGMPDVPGLRVFEAAKSHLGRRAR